MEAENGRRGGTLLVKDGYDARLTDGVRRALGRKSWDFADYAREAAASGVWAEIR